MDQIIDIQYNNPSLLINSTGHSNAIVAFTEDNDINLLLLNNTNKLSINLNENTLHIQNNSNTVLSHHNDTIHVSNINIHNIVSETPLTFNTNKTVFNTDVLFNSKLHLNNYANLPDRIPLLDPATNKIPLSILPQYDDSGSRMIFSKGTHMGIGTSDPKTRLHVFDGHSIFEDSFIGINNRDDYTEPECPIHIRTQYPRIGTPVFKLTNNSNTDTVIMCSENPFIGVGTDTRIPNDNIQFYVDNTGHINNIITSNLLSLDDIHVRNTSFNHMYSNIQILNQDSTRLSPITIDNSNNLYIHNEKLLKENEFLQYDPFSNATWKLNNTPIQQLVCTTSNTYYLVNGFLYKLEDHNYIAKNVIHIKVENNTTLVYKTTNNIVYVYNTDIITQFDNCIDVSLDNTYYYYITTSKPNCIIRRHFQDETLEFIVLESTIYTFKQLSNRFTITNTNDLIDIKDNTRIISNEVKTIKYIHGTIIIEKLDGTFVNSIYDLSGLQWDVALDTYVKIDNSGLLYVNNKNIKPFAISNNTGDIRFTHIACSSRHLAIYDGNCIYTMAFNNDDFDGLGRGSNVLYGIYNSSVLLPVETYYIDRPSVRIHSSCIIGSKGEYIEDIQNDSLIVCGNVGIGRKPNTNYRLDVNGDINISGRIFVNGNDVGSGSVGGVIENVGNDIDNIDLTNYVTKDMLVQEIQSLESGYSAVEIDSMFDIVSNNFQNVNTAIQNIDLNIDIVTPWQHNLTCNVIYIEDKSVAINTSNVDTEQLGSNKIPALYVGNSGNIRGILCEDDIAVFSDLRLKTNIKPIERALDIVSKLNGVYFNRKDVNINDKYIGLIAQDVEKVVPEVVGEVGGYKTVCYSNLIALLIEAIKDIKDILK